MTSFPEGHLLVMVARDSISIYQLNGLGISWYILVKTIQGMQFVAPKAFEIGFLDV